MDPQAAHLAAVERLHHVLEGKLTGESFTLSQSYYLGRVEGVPYRALTTGANGYIDQMAEIPRRPKRMSGNGAAGEHGDAGDDAELIRQIVSAESIHPSATALCARYAARGMRSADIERTVCGFIEASDADPQRKAERKAEVKRAVTSAMEKFGTTDKLAQLKQALAAGAADADNDEDMVPLADIHAEPRLRRAIIEGWLHQRIACRLRMGVRAKATSRC